MNSNKLGMYEYVSVILLPLILFHFCLDFLSDDEIVRDETKIGILQFFHHTVCTIYLSGILILPFISINIGIIILTILVSIITQIGYLINNEYCWVTSMVNKMINPGGNGKRKWVGGDICSLIKSYLYDNWRYSDIKYINNTKLTLIANIVHIIIIINKLHI